MPAPSIARRSLIRTGSKVDFAHPLTKNMLACHVPRGSSIGLVDLMGGVTIPATTGLLTTANDSNYYGYGMKQTATNGGASLVIGATHPLSIQPPLSVMWVGTATFSAQPSSSAALYGVAHNQTDAAPYMCYGLGMDGSKQIALQGNISGTYSYVGSSFVISGERPYVMIGTWGNVGGFAIQRIYANGVMQTENTGTASGPISYASTSIAFLNYYGGVSRDTNTTTNLGCIWNRELSMTEVIRLSADPFQFLRS